MKKILPSDAVLIPDTAKRVFQGEIFDVYQWPQELFDGTDAIFEMLKRPDTVSVICIDDNEILVLDDEQPHTGSKVSFPGGRVDATDTDIVAAAQREVAEETGREFAQWRLVKIWQPHNKIEWFVYLLVAWDKTKQGEPHLDGGEKITVRSLPFEEIKDLVITKAGFLGQAMEIFEPLDSLDQLLALPACQGQAVDR